MPVQPSPQSLPAPAVPEEAARRGALAASPAPLRRSSLRSRGALVAALLALVLGASGAAAAAPAHAAPASAVSSTTVAAAQKALGITADGVAGPQTRRAVRRFQRARGLRVTRRLDRRTLRALGVRASAAPASAPAAAPADAALLARIASCESGGDPAAVSADGRYRGKYQFSQGTWEALGGTGDPAAAPEALQDELAAKLLAQRGTAPWPTCGA